MNDLLSLFGGDDFNKEKKGKGKNAKGEKKGNAAKGVRYPLPVRVFSGHIRCLLDAGEFSGKTVGEADVKKKIRQEYPELAGVQFNLVKFNNSYTEDYEKNNRALQRKTDEEDIVEEKTVDAPLDFAAAEDNTVLDTPKDSEALPEKVAEPMSTTDNSTDGIEDTDSSEEGDEADVDAEEGNISSKGCWIKLDISYEPIAEDQEITLPVTVKVGNVTMNFKEAVDSLAAIREEWVAAHPEYEGCLFHYDDKQRFLIPFMRGESEIIGKKYSLPVKDGYLDNMVVYVAHDFGNDSLESVTQGQIRKLYAVQHPEYENAIFSYIDAMNCLFPIMNFKKTDAKDKYSLPVKLRGSGFVLDLEPSDFNGKTEVTLEEVRVVLEDVYPEFSKERTEMIYDERGFIIPVLKGSKKGITITSTRRNQNLFMVQGKDGYRYRIEQMPYGHFECREDGAEADFHLAAQRIPGGLLCEIYWFFRKNPCKEAAAQIFYDDKTGKYELYFPKQRSNVCHVVFDRDMALEEEKVLVMDIHSHGRMDAFFSSVDDHDEKGTRLFLVLGKIDSVKPACKLRAGITGHYKELALTDVFDLNMCKWDERQDYSDGK